MSSLIMHVDMDAFFAAIEQQMNPSLRGKPVIIGGRNFKYRSIICAASYEAKALGVTNAMPSWKALKICPQAIFVPADTSKYVYTSQRIHDILKTITPQIEKFSIDEFFIDLRGTEKLLGAAEQIGRQIKQQIKDEFGLTCSVGVAPTKTTAKLAAKLKKPDGLTVISAEGARHMLKNMPIDKICGIGKQLKKRFNFLGIETCGQIAEYPKDLLREHFGVVGLWLRAACRVEEMDSIEFKEQSDPPPKSVGHSQTLREVTDDQQYIHAWIHLLSEMVAWRMRKGNLQGRTTHFYISDGFGGGFSKQTTTQQPTDDGSQIYHQCLRIIDLLGISCLRARVMGISVTNLSERSDPYLYDEFNRRNRLLAYLDLINGKYGGWTVYPASLNKAKY